MLPDPDLAINSAPDCDLADQKRGVRSDAPGNASRLQMAPIVRRNFLAIVGGFIAFARSQPAGAESGTGRSDQKRFSIAVPISRYISASDGTSWRNIAQGIASELVASDRFAPIESNLSHSEGTDPDTLPQFDKWRSTGAELLIIGRVTSWNRLLKVECRVWSVANGTQVFGQQYFTNPEDWRHVAHLIAEGILKN
jgi:TolB amino-terminal domain